MKSFFLVLIALAISNNLLCGQAVDNNANKHITFYDLIVFLEKSCYLHDYDFMQKTLKG